MKLKKWLITIVLLLIMMIISPVFAITEMDNGIMQVYTTSGGLEFDELKGFDIKGYITTDESTNEKTLISSTFGNNGYHTFLNVNGINGEMNGELLSEEWKTNAQAMQYTEVEEEDNGGWQTINGISLKLETQFINDGEQLQIVYTLKNTTSNSAQISLSTVADVQIDEDDRATIERLEDGSGVRLWTKEGYTEKPVQFVFYGKDVPGTTDIDNLWIGPWGWGNNIKNMFSDNSDVQKIEDQDSSFSYSWTNRTIQPGEIQTYSVLMEVGEINIPNTGITLDDNTKFYYTDVKIKGNVIDKDLKDKIIIHYVVDGTEYTLPEMSTTGDNKEFILDLTTLNLSTDKEHTLKVWATDSTECESNVEEKVFTVTYLKNPTLTLSETEWTKDDVTFRITDTVNLQQYVDKYQYRINNGSWVDCQKDVDLPIQENGMTQVDVRIVGTETNDYSDIITEYAKIDRVNPTTTIPTATKTTCSITVNSSQTDAHSGIDETKTMYAIKIGESWGEWQSSNIFSGLIHNTEYVVKTKSTDLLGNSSESEELTVKTEELLLGNLILKLNNNEGVNYTENTWTNQNIYVAVQEQSVGATTTYYSKEGSEETITATNQEITVTKDGTTILLLSTTDGTNTITSDIEHILKIDKIAPVINELSLDKEEWTTIAKFITGKAIDLLSGISAYQFSTQSDLTSSSTGWNSITNTNEEITQTKEVEESGKYYFYVKDEAGNVASVSIDTKIDGLGPVITFTRANGQTVINVTDTGAGVKNTYYAWTNENNEPSDEEWKAYSKAVTYGGTSKEKLYLWAKAIDKADNATTSSTVFSAIKEPTIVSENEFVNKYANFKLNSQNEDLDIIYQFKINDGEWKNITKDSSHTITNITEGNVEISARVLDNAGRYSDITDKSVNVSIIELPEDEEQDNINNDDKNNSEADETIANGKIPHAGASYKVIIFIVLLVATIIFAYRKINLYRDI